MFGFGHKAEMPAQSDEAAGGGGDKKTPEKDTDRSYVVDTETGTVIMGEEGQSDREVLEEARHDLGKE